MSKKLILLVLAIVSSALVFGCNTATAEPEPTPDEDIFSVQSYENGLFEQIFGDTVAECNVFVFSVPEIRERNVICIELANGETGLAYRSSANEPLTISETGMSLNVLPMVDFGG